jgi:hypothetical protein
MATVSTTVVEAWDKRWTTAEGRADWLDPDPEVMALLPELMGRGARTAPISGVVLGATRCSGITAYLKNGRRAGKSRRDGEPCLDAHDAAL